ncbi:MAG: Hsp20/alpha crystallin family protein [Gammaproteobacteria bacterium SHHR-1]|uniref:Hsp20/alpha crystallin family protein n=1 Tax=Magnetovirga frankeli TaxID=947516 RepID=UPI0012940B62|nr:Hsp20/alpha crystallin family protein [gamma proteobacterium SS-5]
MSNQETNPGQDSKARADQERTLRPAVDIFEDATGITVMADMPGVPKEKLDIQVDKDSLSIGGEILLEMPAEMEPVHADVRLTRYQRSFTLSRELDTDQVEANFKDGVLILRIPKAEAHQTRKIQVRAA